jgi:hypothetical protein
LTEAPIAGGGRRRPGRVRRWVVRPVVWLLILVLVLVAANVLFWSSRWARQSAADLLRGELSDALGREVAVESVDFHLWTFDPWFEVRGVVIPGPTLAEPPVLRVALARARISWRALARRRLDLEQVDLERPWFNLRLDADGTTNLPHLRRQGGGGSQRLQVAIDRMLVQGGVFKLNGRRARVDLTARGLWARFAEAPHSAVAAAAAAPAAPASTGAARAAAGAPRAVTGAPPVATATSTSKAAAGTVLDYLLTAQDVALVLPGARSYPLSLSVRGQVDSGRVRLAAGRLAGPDLKLHVNGAIAWEGDNEIGLGVTASMATHWLNRVGYLAEPIDGQAEIAGRFTLRRDAWEYAGTLRAPRIGVLHREFRDLAADFRGGSETLQVAVRRVVYAGGTLSGPVIIATGANPGPHGGRPVDLDLEVRGMRLQPFLADLFPAQFGGREPPVAELAGQADGRLRFRFESSAWRDGSGEAQLAVEPAQVALAGGRGLAMSGVVPLAIAGGVISGGTVLISAPGQEATVTGFAYDLHRDSGRLDYRLVSHDTGALAPLFPPVAPRQPTAHWTGPPETLPIWLPNAGHGTASGTVTIDPVGYAARFDLDLSGVVDHSLGAADRLHGSLTLKPLAVEDLHLEATAGQGALILSGSIPLAASPDRTSDQALDLGIDAADWPAAGLIPYLPAWFPVAGLAGEVSGRVDLGGDFEHLTGRADAEIEGLALAGQALGKARGQLSWDPARIAVDDGVIENAAGKLLAHGSFDRAGGAIDLTLDAPDVNLAAEPVAGLLHAPDLAGRATVMATIGGTLDRPRATASLRTQGLSLSGRPLGGGAAAGEAQVTVDWDGELLRAGGTVGDLLTFDGGGRLDRHQAAVRFDLRSANLAGLARAAFPSTPDFTGSLAGGLTFDADLDSGRYSGELRLDDLRLAYGGRQIANREPVVVAITPQRLQVRSLYLSEAGTDLEAFAGGSIGLAAPRPLDLHLQSTVAASWVKLFVPGLDLAGAIDVLATVRGTLSEPDLSGQAVLHDARVVLPTIATFDNLEGTIRFYRDRVVLDELSGRVGGGTLRANGQVALPGAGRTVTYRLDVATQGVSLRYPEGWVSRGDATFSLIGSGATRQLQGTVRLNRALYVQDLQVDPLQLLLRGLQRERVQVTPTNDLLSKTQVNLSIQGPGALRVTNNVADLRGDIALTVAGTAASPVVFGSVALEAGGTLEYSDNKYQVDHGVLTFANPNRVDPLIDLALKTDVQSYQITLNLSGTLEKLQAKFSSNGDLADSDILGLLASGSRPEIGAPPPPGPQSDAASQAAASQFLAGQASSALGSRVGKLFGLDRFRLDTQTLTQAGEPTSGVVITAGKRLSKNIFITYVSNPSSPRLDVRQVEWTVGKNITVLLTQSGNSFAVDVQRETRF